MLCQIKYSSRQGLSLRLFTLGVAIALNIVFGILAAANISSAGVRVTAVVLVSLSLCAVFITAIIADLQIIRGMFSAPTGYLAALTPAPGWKQLLGRIVPMAVLDLGSLAIAIGGVVLQSLLLANQTSLGMFYGVIDAEAIGAIIYAVLLVIIAYTMLITAIFFGCALSRSVFFRTRLKWVLAFIGVIAAFYLLSWLDLSLAMVAPVVRHGIFFEVAISSGLNAGTIGYLLLALIKTAVMFFAAAYLVDRRINL